MREALGILHSKVGKAIKKLWDKMATGDDDIPRDVLKLLGEDGLKITKQLINMHETGE
jgi:hypothetical protein